MFSPYVNGSEKESCIWLLVAEHTVNLLQTQIKENLSTGLNGGRTRHMVKRER